MDHAIVFGRVVAQTARVGTLIALWGGLACSSGDNAAPSDTTSGQGGSSNGGHLGNDNSGGIALAAGGTVVNGSGGTPSGSGGHSGGASSSNGGSASSGNAGSSAHASGGLSGTGSTVASGASSTAGSTTTVNGFNPCPATGDCKILPLGDSITAGAGAQPGDNGGYRVELFTKATNDSKHITFVGSLTSGPSTVAGTTFPKNHEGHIGWKIDQINGIATTAQTVSVSGTSYAGALKDMPNIVLLFAGTNDEGCADSAPGASDRLGTLIDKIVTALPNALLVVSSIYPFPGCKATNYTATQCAASVATYDAAIPGVVQQRVAQGKHVLYVDMSTPPTGALSTDGVHPNATVGYPWMGDTWYGVIKSYLH
jgi:lysophospholipase L1-like esterase